MLSHDIIFVSQNKWQLLGKINKSLWNNSNR